MNKFDLAAKITLGAFVAMVLFACLVAALNPVEGSNLFNLVKAASLIITLMVVIPGLYLWITGFKRFKNHLGHWGPKMLFYLVFTIIYAVYIQLKHGHELQKR